MSDVRAVRYLLANYAPLTAVVPAASIVGGVVPQGVAAPSIGIQHISAPRRWTSVAGTESLRLCAGRVQVTALVATYDEVKTVLDLVRAALPRTTRGTVNGVSVVSILDDIEGPDFSDPNTGVFMRSIDYIVTYNE